MSKGSTAPRVAEGTVDLSPLPRSLGPLPAEQRPRQQRKHGRQYSVQLDIGDSPVEHKDSESELERKELPDVPGQRQLKLMGGCQEVPLTPNHHPARVDHPRQSKLHLNGFVTQTERASPSPCTPPELEPEPSSEELFARRFGYRAHVQATPPSPQPEETRPASLIRPRPHSYKRSSTHFSEEEEGSLVVLPPPPLLRPSSFWRNTPRSALHTPSYHLVRRATFLAAGLSFDRPTADLSAFAVESRITIGKAKGLSGSAGVPDPTPFALVPPLSLSTSSFNWWPYPPGGVVTSTPTLMSTLTPTPTTALVATTSSDVAASPSSSDPSSSSDPASSSPSITAIPTFLIQVTALTSIPPSATSSSEPRTPYRYHRRPFNKLWLIPVCVVAGALLGCAVGWTGWRFWEKRKRTGVGGEGGANGYAWAYQGGSEAPAVQHHDDKDMERGVEYASLGRKPSRGIGDVERMPSRASTSGARTWIERAQARKRSGGAGARLASTSSPPGQLELVTSPLLGPDPDSELTSPQYPYGDDDDGLDDPPYETLRHKSIRRRIWERLGFGDIDALGKDVDERKTWSGGKREDRASGIGRSSSLWGRRKTLKEGRVERWVRGVEEPREDYPTIAEETPLQEATPHPDLGTLRRVSSACSSVRKHGHVDSDVNLADVPGVDGKALVSYLSWQDGGSGSRSLPKSVGTSRGTHVRQQGTSGGSRGVSLQDMGPVPGSQPMSRPAVKKPHSTSKNAFPLRSMPSSKSSQSRTNSRLPGPTPPTPPSVSRNSATPRTPGSATSLTRAQNRTSTRTPPRSAPSKAVWSSPSKATPPSRVSRVSPAASPSRGGNTPPRARPSPARGVHARLQQRPLSQLPAGPSLVMSPPLQSALCFDPTPLPSTPRTAGGTKAVNKLLQSRHSPHSSNRSQPRSMRPFASGPTPPSVRMLPGTAHRRTPSPVTGQDPRPRSPKDRYLARQSANARVGMILTRSYDSHDLGERPTSPTMFGAVIGADVPNYSSEQDVDAPENNTKHEGIEQRLDRLRMQEQGVRADLML